MTTFTVRNCSEKMRVGFRARARADYKAQMDCESVAICE